jgi:hypothetical protein
VIPHGFLTETRSYEFEVQLDGKRLPDDHTLLLNDIPVDRITRRGSTLFLFDMDFYAGDLRIAVSRGNHILREVDVRVDPDKAKLTRDEYAAMIADTLQATLALYRLSHITLPAQTSLHGIRSNLVTLELIRTHFDAFERAATRIADQPVRTLRSTSLQVDIIRARRVDDRAIGAALRSNRSRAATAIEASAAPRLVGALGGRWIPTIMETRRRESVDCYENRALLGFLYWLDGTLSNLARRLSADASADRRSLIIMVYAERIARWRAKLAMLARRGMFTEISADATLHATSIFRTHPDYASAFSAMSKIRATIGLGGTAAPAVPLDRTYELYEIWCYVGLLAAVADRFPDSRSKIAEILRGCPSPSGLGVVLSSGGAHEIPLDHNIYLTYQRRFAVRPAPDGARTLVIEAVPDVTLSRNSPDGECVALVILDAKYRTGASLLDGLRDMHVYRDAIVNSQNFRLVKAAVALAPRSLGQSGPLSSFFPLDRPGIHSIRPNSDPSSFVQLLDLSLHALCSA